MDNLIAELEAATEGSRDLDGEIALSLGWVKHHAGWAHWTTPEGLENQHVPFFSDSLDAALTLVPEGWVWHVQIDYELPGRANLYNAVPGGKDDPPVHVQADGATPVLALCIASLKARQAMEEAA